MTENRSTLYIGLISGTSVDALDVALVDFCEQPPKLITTLAMPIPSLLRQNIRQLQFPENDGLDLLGETDQWMGELSADAVTALLSQQGLNSRDIRAIGSHGQTVRHRPAADRPFTLQIGDPNLIAERSGISVIADFRRRDMAAGGQGAPFAPAFHQHAFSSPEQNRAILNLGGIANVTLLPANANPPLLGYDCGTANTLLDYWFRKHHPANNGYDKNGQWAASGKVDETLLATMLSDAYFDKKPPKSTGPEDFSPAWLETKLASHCPPAEDVQRTLLELTCQTAADACSDADAIYVCGGGAHNKKIMHRLSELSDAPVQSTLELGIHPDWVEAILFAWLAHERIEQKPVPLASVTGAKTDRCLGAVYLGKL